MQQAIRQRLRFELGGLECRDLEQQAVGGARLLLQHELKSGGHVKSALLELLSGLDTCSKNAVKLRLQLAEYCILKCTSKAQLPALLPLLTKQGNKVLAANRNDAACISALAALMASCAAKLLHEPPRGSYALTHGRPCGDIDTAGVLCEALLFPVIKSTYRDPEQARVAAGSEVLLALLEVLKAYAQQLEHASEAMHMCLELMVQLLSMGTVVQRVPGVLLPVCTCLDTLGGGAGKECIKRVLLLCFKGAVSKDVWQARRDSLQTMAVLAACVLGLAAAVVEAGAAAGEAEHQLLHPSAALRVLVVCKPQAMQVLEDAKCDKIAAVRAAAAAALANFSAVPDTRQPVATAAPTAPDTPSAMGGCRHGASSRHSSSDTTAKQRLRQPAGIKSWQATGTRSNSAAPHRFTRPKVPAGAMLDYGIQVFAPPSPQRPMLSPQSPHLEHGHADAACGVEADQTPARRQLDFDAAQSKVTSASPQGMQPSADAASQTCEACGPAHQSYTVTSPLSGVYAHPFAMPGGVPGSPHSAAGTGQLHSSDALQMTDQNQQQHALAILASDSGLGAAQLHISHHVHGRVELGVVPGSPMASAIGPDAARAAAFAPAVTEHTRAAVAAAAAATVGSPVSSMVGAAHTGAGGNLGAGAHQLAWWPLQAQLYHQAQQQPWEQQEEHQQHQQQHVVPAVQPHAAAKVTPAGEPVHSARAQHAAAEPSSALVPEDCTPPNWDCAIAEAATPLPDSQAAVAAVTTAAATGELDGQPGITGACLLAAAGGCELSLAAPAAEAVPGHQHAGLMPQDGDSYASSIGSTAAVQHARRARLRWQLPGAEQLEAAADGQAEGCIAAAAGSAMQAPAAFDNAFSDVASPLPCSPSLSRCSLKSMDGSCSRQSSRSAHDPGSSLAVLRSVGARVQGLLESLSRQTSTGGKSSSSSGAAVARSEDSAQEACLGSTAPAAADADADADAAVCGSITNGGQVGAASSSTAACLANLLSSPDTSAGMQQQEAQHEQEQELSASPHTLRESFQLLASLQQLSEVVTAPAELSAAAAAEHSAARSGDDEEAADVHTQECAVLASSSQLSWQQQGMKASTDQGCHAMASSELLSSHTCTEKQAAAATAGLEAPAGIPQSVREQQELQQLHSFHAPIILESSLSLQSIELYQPESFLTARPAAAGLPDVALQTAQQSSCSAAGSSSGLAQVERALLKLQALRSNLQSIGSSAASSRQQSRRASRTIGTVEEITVCSPDRSSSQVPGASSTSNTALAQPGDATLAMTSHADTTGGAQAVSTGQGGAAPLHAREWIKQLSQRIQQAGTGDTSSAAQLEAAMASLQVQQAGTEQAAPAAPATAAEPADPRLAAASAAAGHVARSKGSSLVQTSLPTQTAAEGATAAVLSDAELEAAVSPGVSRCSSRVSQHASMAQLQLLDSSCVNGGIGEPACSPATAVPAAAAAVAAAAPACEEAASSADVSTLSADCNSGRVATPTADSFSEPWAAGLALAGPGSPSWSTATAADVEEPRQLQGIAYANSTRAGSSAPAGIQQQPPWELVASSAEEDARGAGPVSAGAELRPGNSQLGAADGASGGCDAAAPAAATAHPAGVVTAAPPAGRLQQMLDASDDTALLLSLALKLDMLAKKFRAQGRDANATSGRLLDMPGRALTPNVSKHVQPVIAAAAACSTDSPPVQWMSVTHNDLFVPSPVQPAAGAGSAKPEQQLSVLSPASPCSWAGEASSSLVLMPGSPNAAASSAAQQAGESPQQQLQAAALLQVLGIDLQELHSGGPKVAAKVHHACSQLQHRLSEYEQQPLAGLARAGAQQKLHVHCGQREDKQHSGRLEIACHVDSSSGGQVSQLTEQQLQPLRVLLIHEYQQVIGELCRQQCLQQQPVLYSWDSGAQAAAQEHVQLFSEQQLPLVVELLLKHADANAV